MATFASDGSLANVQSLVNAAATGDTVTLPDGNFTWAGTLTLNKAITLRAVNTPNANPPSPTVHITHANGANGLITINTTPNGHITLAGLAFWPNEQSGYYVQANITGTTTTILMHDCSFSNYFTGTALVNSVLWSGYSGVIWNCRFHCTARDGVTVAQSANFGWGTTNGCLKIKGSKLWYDASSFGALDTTGLINTYVEDCTFEHQWSQAIDADDNARTNIRHCNFINSQIGVHGITSDWGGRQTDINNNVFNFLPFGTAANNGAKAVNLNRWCWWRAGTTRVWGNAVDDINSQDWGSKPCWVFIDEPLTRPGAGNGGNCETQAMYPGTRWVGTGGNGVQHPSGVIVTPSFVDPMYFWNNTAGPHSNGATKWGTNDQSGFSCNNGPTSAVFLLNRDIFLSAPNNNPSPPYTEYVYPHPLRTGGGGGGGGGVIQAGTASNSMGRSVVVTPRAVRGAIAKLK